MEEILNNDDADLESAAEETPDQAVGESVDVSEETAEPAQETETPKKVKKTRKPLKVWLEGENAARTLYLGFGFIAILLLMILLQFSTSAICCGDWDGYYHIRWSAMIWENFKQFKWLPEFRWLPLTVLNAKDYADHHFLFHLLQIPFLWIFEAVTAAKVAAVFYGTLAIFSVYWLLYRYNVNYLIVWLLALLTCANPFFYRMSMAKAPPLTIIITIAGIYFLFERKYVLLLPLMFVFVWTYSLFPLLFIAAAIWVAVIGWNEKKFEWQPLAYTGGGMILGNLINPYFPNNLSLFTEHFLTKIGGSFDVPVGGEWYPYTGTQLLTHLSVALIAMFVGYVLYRPRNRYLPEKTTFFLIFSTILLIWMFKSKRLAEYFPPFAILFCAFSWTSFIRSATPQLPEDFRREIEPLLDSEKTTEKGELIGTIKQAVPWVLGTILACLMFYNFVGINIKALGIKQEGLITSIKNNQTDDKYVEAMEWARANIPAGETIFNCNWDDFPKLFFLDTSHYYVYGLDPKYLHSKDAELYKLIKDITSGKIDDPAPIIRDKFGATYIFSDATENEDFIAKILESGWADKVYEDGEAYILKIRAEKGDPPEESDVTPDTQEEAQQLQDAENADEANIDNANQNVNDNLLDEEDDSDLDEEDYPDEEEVENTNARPPE